MEQVPPKARAWGEGLEEGGQDEELLEDVYAPNVATQCPTSPESLAPSWSALTVKQEWFAKTEVLEF